MSLEHLAEFPYDARYLRAGRPGVLGALWLHAEVVRRLRAARAALRDRDPRLDLLVWDGWRPPSVQRGLFTEYVALLVAEGLAPAAAREQARTFVADPDGVFPHGTGGAVDLTLTVDGAPAAMGTDFDDFTERAHRSWYRTHPPTADRDAAAAANRRLLDEVMAGAGFVGIENEWWHYEWGTRRWAHVTGEPVRLTATPEPAGPPGPR